MITRRQLLCLRSFHCYGGHSWSYK